MPTRGDYCHSLAVRGAALAALVLLPAVAWAEYQGKVQILLLGDSATEASIQFTSDNMDVIIAYLKSSTNGYDEHNVFVSEQDRQNGKVVVPAGLIQSKGTVQVWLVGENRYGRLKKRRDVVVKE